MGDDPNPGGNKNSQDTESMSLELWDTVTNEIKVVGQPPVNDNDNAILFRPMILTLGEDSILFTGGSITRNGNAMDHDGKIFQYTCGTPGKWESRGTLNPPLVSRQMYGIYTIKEESQNQKNILNTCACPPERPVELAGVCNKCELNEIPVAGICCLEGQVNDMGICKDTCPPERPIQVAGVCGKCSLDNVDVGGICCLEGQVNVEGLCKDTCPPERPLNLAGVCNSK